MVLVPGSRADVVVSLQGLLGSQGPIGYPGTRGVKVRLVIIIPVHKGVRSDVPSLRRFYPLPV